MHASAYHQMQPQRPLDGARDGIRQTPREPIVAATRAFAGRSPDPPWLDDETLAAVRPEVRQLLRRSQAFAALPVAQQREIAQNMVRVASYMSNPDGLARQEFAEPTVAKIDAAVPVQTRGVRPSTARALADAVESAQGKASDKIGTFAGADFKGGAIREGTQTYKELIGSVDFPKFVGGLIQNVFQAIVSASIQQMQAYSEMLKSVAQTVDQFAQDNISDNNTRDWLVDKFPDQLDLDESGAQEEGGSPRVVPKGEDSDALLTAVNQQFRPLQPITDLSDPEQEARLVNAAKLQMARVRQQMLASMMILGINRIVITDGAINAKVLFELKASDQAKRRARASLYDADSSKNTNTTAAGASWGWGGAASVNENIQEHVTTVSSSVDENSESKAEVKAKLRGEVRVNFKSDYFPMEKLASPGMIASIQGNATPYDPNPPRPAASGATAVPPTPAPTPAPDPAAARA